MDFGVFRLDGDALSDRCFFGRLTLIGLPFPARLTRL